MYQTQLNIVVLFVVLFSICGNCVPFPGQGIKSSDLINGSLKFPETSETKATISPSEDNVKDNLVQSGENDGNSKNKDGDEISGQNEDPQGENNKQYFETDSAGKEGKTQLSKFYRSGISPRSVTNPSSSSDSILFPSAVEASETYNAFPASGFSDRYNRHRPNIPTPQVSIPFNFGFGLPAPLPPAPVHNNRRSQGQGQPRLLRSGSSNDFLTREEDALLYQSLVELFRGLFTRQQFRRDSQPQPEASYNRITFIRPTMSIFQINSTSSTSTTIKKEEEGQEVDGVNYQSLYSGPKFDKSPCPAGMHRSHGGSCQKSPRKLLKSSG